MVRSKCIFCIIYSCINTFCVLLSFPGHAPNYDSGGHGEVKLVIYSLVSTMWTQLKCQVLEKLLQTINFTEKDNMEYFLSNKGKLST